MIAILIFIVIGLGLNLIPQLTNKELPKNEKNIIKLMILATFFFLALMILFFNGYWLKGLYSSLIVKLIFILTSVVYFTRVKNTRRKLISAVLIIPLMLLTIGSVMLSQPVYRYKINKDLNLLISREGFLACGEIIRLTKSEFGIFERELIYDSNQCLIGIKKIETIQFNKNQAEFLIYHNGKMDSENPYNYIIENKHLW
ncbi:hypothetical protein [Fluviicola taffensis]|uniref:hypothetical protein n=1 Tax=Fluviicola taffensis TaxID=191579 RepID=UPI0031378607